MSHGFLTLIGQWQRQKYRVALCRLGSVAEHLCEDFSSSRAAFPSPQCPTDSLSTSRPGFHLPPAVLAHPGTCQTCAMGCLWTASGPHSLPTTPPAAALLTKARSCPSLHVCHRSSMPSSTHIAPRQRLPWLQIFQFILHVLSAIYLLKRLFKRCIPSDL